MCSLTVNLSFVLMIINSEVRRAAILHIPLTAITLGPLLRRTRDIDALTRKLVYTSVVGTKLKHPRQLSIADRELIVKDGLGDREPGVRVAAGKLVVAWFDVVLSEAGKDNEESNEGEDEWQGDDSGVMKGLAKFLSLFDVVGPGEEVAVNAVLSIFTTRRELLEVFVFAGTLIPNTSNLEMEFK